MKTLKLALLMTGLIAAPLLYADCSVTLPHEQLVDCIVKQNAPSAQQFDVVEDQKTSKQAELPLNSQPKKLANVDINK